jgi:aldehyde:ferredoxin oxidoreductase
MFNMREENRDGHMLQSIFCNRTQCERTTLRSAKGNNKINAADTPKFEAAVAVQVVRSKAKGYLKGMLSSHGTAGLVLPAYAQGELPIRNLQTNVLENVEKIDGTYFREHFEHRPKTCHKCPIAHNAWIKIKEGPYAGLEFEEPEYENISTLGSNLEILNAEALIYLSYLADDLGINITEAGWVMSWLYEVILQRLCHL